MCTIWYVKENECIFIKTTFIFQKNILYSSTLYTIVVPSTNNIY